jgi:hypothetical protein
VTEWLRPVPLERTTLGRSGMILVAVTLAGVSCGPQGDSGRLPDQPARAREAILRVVPRGSTVATAEASMANLGFSCSPQVDASFQGASGVRSHIDYLYCDARTSGLVYTRWQAAVIHDHGHVTDVDVSVGLTGP